MENIFKQFGYLQTCSFLYAKKILAALILVIVAFFMKYVCTLHCYPSML